MADVAKKAGVALSTVSYALNGTRPISEETKRRIFDSMSELGYHPNALARSLVTKRSRVISLLLPSTPKGLSEVQLEFLTNAANAACASSYGFLLWTSPTDEQETLRLAREGLIEGLILMEVKLRDPRVELLRDLGFPFTMIGRCENNDGLSYVDFDFEGATRLCVQHLAQLGHRRIVLLNSSATLIESGYGPAVRTEEGFQTGIHDYALQGAAIACDATPDAGYKTMQSILSSSSPPSAVITANDRITAGVIQALNERGLCIPDGFSIVARLSSHAVDLMAPPLTAVEVPAADLGRMATEMLIRQLEGEEQQLTQVILPPKLTVRQSSGPWMK